jgi:HSP20 family protein
MIDKKKKENNRDITPFDIDNIWDFEDIFENMSERIEKMHNEMNRMMEFAMQNKNNKSGVAKPFVYGYSFQIGFDGKPRFQEFGTDLPQSEMITEAREPYVDIAEHKDMISITVELPGVQKDEIELDVKERKVVIKVDNDKRKFYKEIELPSVIKKKSITTSYQNGVLDIELKKK